MKELNWNKFKAKFNGKEEKSFESLSYLLFCREFGQPNGIFRYFNQTGIETEPVLVNGEWIGFQSKFYETKISENVANLKKSILKAKSKNKNLNKIYFYLNQEFSESSKKTKKEPEYKKEIEKYAKSQAVQIEWRVPSHFEIQLSYPDTKNLAQHFFSLEKSVIDFLTELSNHTTALLKPIRSHIRFNSNEIKIDRTKTIKALQRTLETSPFVVLSGEGGVGKTALVKDIYDTIGETHPFFMFKAAEFNVPHINQFFKNYGDFSLTDFIEEFNDETEKYIVIDSAEKISDLQYTEPLQEFLGTLLEHNWKVIFTTRYSYLDDLRFQFIEIYQIDFKLFFIEKLEIIELEALAQIYDFELPKNEKLLEVLKNPFYLNEYLKIYQEVSQNTNYAEFKNLLWKTKIAKSADERETCFLTIAEKRANTMSFFVDVDEIGDKSALKALETDEVIKKDTQAGGYFITHDVYEEWALDKIIEGSFSKAESISSFFDSLGESLPFRRAFREWLSEKLQNNLAEVKFLVDESLENSSIKKFWKDEIIVSVLLSDYSKIFFQMFEKTLLENDQELLIRIIFLLRTACKETDEDSLISLGISRKHRFSLDFVFTKPKGSGWSSTIAFVYKYLVKIGLSKINYILPLISDWNSKFKEGLTTKQASQIALFLYEEIHSEKYRYSFRNNTAELIKVIVGGSAEIKKELTEIFEEVVSKKEKSHQAKYYELAKASLSSALESFEIAKNLPEQIIKLANLFWLNDFDEEDDEYKYTKMMEIEDHFGISANSSDYFPASTFQTPVYQLLKFAPDQTIDFILDFTNKTVEAYVKSDLDSGRVEEVEICIKNAIPINQYINGRIWNVYRGTQTNPYLLSSIHMALEKYLLEHGKIVSGEILESWCKHILQNSKSASMTALVISLALAYPEKLFNIALILFQTKELFHYDTSRLVLDQSAKDFYSFGSDLNSANALFENERIKTCDDKHRKFSLEHLAFKYQIIHLAEKSDFETQRNKIWEILDDHYKNLLSEAEQTEEDKVWRICLARMDARKMTYQIEEQSEKNGTTISFKPNLDDDIRQISEDSRKKTAENMKYMPLLLWAKYRYRNDTDNYKKYPQYEENPKLVIAEAKEITQELNNKGSNSFSLFYSSAPGYVCVVLLRDFFEKLNNKEKDSCLKIISEIISIPLQDNDYSYQFLDGTEPAVSNIDLLFKHFPESKDEIKSILLLLLLHSDRKIKAFAVNSFHNGFWEFGFDDAQSLFLGYLYLKPKYDKARKEIMEENYNGEIVPFTGISTRGLIPQFCDMYEEELKNIISNKIAFDSLKNLETLSFGILNRAFYLLPNNNNDETHHRFVAEISKIFADNEKMSAEDKKYGFTLKRKIYRKFAFYVLNSSEEKARIYIQPFVESFGTNKNIVDLLDAFVSAEDNLNQYENFWIIWELFYEEIVEMCKKSRSHYNTKPIVRNYLLAQQEWKKDAKTWRSLKDRERLFFRKIAKDIGWHPSVFYSLLKFLDEIGREFIDDGIVWISDIIKSNKDFVQEELEMNTIYYLENLVRKYILTNRGNIRKTKRIKNQIIIILDFLVEKGSSTGYLLREEIL